MLGDELGTASNIKSRVNRQSVLGAITSAQQRLKLYTKVRLLARIVQAYATEALHTLQEPCLQWIAWLGLPNFVQ